MFSITYHSQIWCFGAVEVVLVDGVTILPNYHQGGTVVPIVASPSSYKCGEVDESAIASKTNRLRLKLRKSYWFSYDHFLPLTIHHVLANSVCLLREVSLGMPAASITTSRNVSHMTPG